jgi:BirA family transcriptional regulator, biotin operon repressor / biotin---[acetyl-CoA-carboxylase] ligase
MNTELVGIKIIQLTETASTNNALKKLLNQEVVPEGLVLCTDYQTLGRGQFGNTWESARGKNLLFSTIFYPKFLKLSESYRLTMSVCLGICDFLETLDLNPKIKWPNDVLIDGKKASGTLLESSLNVKQFEHVVVGIGLNVNQQNFQNDKATSLKLITGLNYQLNVLSKKLYSHLSLRYAQLKSGGAAEQQRTFNAKLHGQDQRVPIIWETKEYWVYCRGVDPQGNLLVEFNDGSFQLFKHKEITFKLRE